ncbi:MAG: MBL fold metallo-hydrolase [Bacteroidia bacterium]|nr:MBL fold metallo-hydrolase [Bacteroidia bacterium]MCF8427940.1 MBL fold metallo-hydrolase [Bacteroidia bacterium]MCF8447440.1 MBL fold metallo-hydrolase [Bacteroidia bacterium]
MRKCKLFLNYSGYCLAKAHHAVKGDDNINIKFHALFGLIQHPEMGWILFDTGYTDRFFKATDSFPNKLYALITKVTIEKKDEVKQQLKSYGILPEEIKHIIISHFHADHIGGLKDFENATFYCSQTAYQQVKKINNLLSFSKGILKYLIPHDIEKRLKFIETICEPEMDDIFGKRYNLFNDDSIYVYELPGHAAGQIGIYLQTNKAKYFLIADACWDERAFKILAFPHPIVRSFFDSWKDYKNIIQKIKRFHEKNTDVIIVPTHCETTTKLLIQSNFNIDAL